MNNLNLLPAEKSFEQLLLPYFAPYFLYTFLTTFWPELMDMESSQATKLVLVSLAMLYFAKHYRLPAIELKVVGVALLATPVALGLWLAPLYLFVDTTPGAIDKPLTDTYFYLRLFNSVVLVAIFEELLTRVYLVEWFYAAGQSIKEKGPFAALMDTLDEHPKVRDTLPLSALSVGLATLIFTLGHAKVEYLSAVLYFGFTFWIYHLTRSIWSCILVHALTNLAIAFMVKELGMYFLWW